MQGDLLIEKIRVEAQFGGTEGRNVGEAEEMNVLLLYIQLIFDVFYGEVFLNRANLHAYTAKERIIEACSKSGVKFQISEGNSMTVWLNRVALT